MLHFCHESAPDQSQKIVHLALYQPDIPQNTGTLLRLGACLKVAVHVIGPAGFDLSDRRLKRAGMDYLAQATLVRHVSFDALEAWRRARLAHRLVLMTTAGTIPYFDFAFQPDDCILLGRESGGVPTAVHQAADARLVIPMVPGLRSINVAVAAAMVIGEALRQTSGFLSAPGATRALS
jgi:tRNA (cytidine/uridine-2'-O-)-methyltransferase